MEFATNANGPNALGYVGHVKENNRHCYTFFAFAELLPLIADFRINHIHHNVLLAFPVS